MYEVLTSSYGGLFFSSKISVLQEDTSVQNLCTSKAISSAILV